MSPELPPGSIVARDVWKRFKPDRNQSALAYEMKRMAARLRRNPLDWQWALRSVDIEADPGEAIGLVGNNGSGKTTLLRVLGKIMYPYSGTVEVRGRIGALIAVKAGIQPELTGAENIHLYGSLLGLKRSEVAARFDEIVSFAQLESAIDRQVKYYSSGMQMRLGFGVAAHLDPHILLVDEVLAVGDASFQQRCLDRMRTVLSEGATVVFVSHDLASVESVSTRGVWLDQGVVRADGPIDRVLGAYRAAIEGEAGLGVIASRDLSIVEQSSSNPEGSTIRTQEPIDLEFVVRTDRRRSTTVHMGITEGTADPIVSFTSHVSLTNGETAVRCHLPRLPLPGGRFAIWVEIAETEGGTHPLLPWQPVMDIDVLGPDLDRPPKAVVRRSPVHAEVSWEHGPRAAGSDGISAAS